MHLAPAQHAEGVGRLAGLDAQRNVAQQFAFEPVLYMPGGEEFPVFAGNLCQFQCADISGHRCLCYLKSGTVQSCSKFFLCINVMLLDQLYNFFVSCTFHDIPSITLIVAHFLSQHFNKTQMVQFQYFDAD